MVSSGHTNGHFCSTRSGRTPPLHDSTGQQQSVVFGEATGFAICFQNHIDYNKLDIKHCLVLSWVKPAEEGPSPSPSFAWCHTWPSAFSPSVVRLPVSFLLVAPPKVFLPRALLASSFASCSANFLNMLA